MRNDDPELAVEEAALPLRPVQAAAERLRDLIYAAEPETRIGSLTGLARELGVGIVTVQQAARILEFEGLLEVRRGPGGGYYGRRPDAAVLERSLAAYMRTQPATWEEALDITSLLFNELVAAAAASGEGTAREELRGFAGKVESAAGENDVARFEEEFQDLLFRMVDRPLFELLTRVTLRFSVSLPEEATFRHRITTAQWIDGRRRIIEAILRRDEELARFEANRCNRRLLMQHVRGAG